MKRNVLASLAAAGACMVAANALAAEPSGDAAQPAQPIDACALLLPSEISQVIGMPVSRGQRNDAGPQKNSAYSSTCLWTVAGKEQPHLDPSAPLGGRSFVILNAMRWPAGSGLARSFLEAFRKAAANGDIPNKPVPRSVGDESLWWGDGLAVCKGDVSFGISVFVPGSTAAYPGEREEHLAGRILARLADGRVRGRAPGQRDRERDQVPEKRLQKIARSGPADRALPANRAEGRHRNQDT